MNLHKKVCIINEQNNLIIITIVIVCYFSFWGLLILEQIKDDEFRPERYHTALWFRSQISLVFTNNMVTNFHHKKIMVIGCYNFSGLFQDTPTLNLLCKGHKILNKIAITIHLPNVFFKCINPSEILNYVMNFIKNEVLNYTYRFR